MEASFKILLQNQFWWAVFKEENAAGIGVVIRDEKGSSNGIHGGEDPRPKLGCNCGSYGSCLGLNLCLEYWTAIYYLLKDSHQCPEEWGCLIGVLWSIDWWGKMFSQKLYCWSIRLLTTMPDTEQRIRPFKIFVYFATKNIKCTFFILFYVFTITKHLRFIYSIIYFI